MQIKLAEHETKSILAEYFSNKLGKTITMSDIDLNIPLPILSECSIIDIQIHEYLRIIRRYTREERNGTKKIECIKALRDFARQKKHINIPLLAAKIFVEEM